MAKVITWSIPGAYETIDITPRQERMLGKAGLWLRTERGEFCQVEYGLHRGEPSYSDDEIDMAILTGELGERIALV